MAVGREASIDSFSFPAVCYEVDPKDLEGSHVPRISSQDPPMCLFLPDSPCLPAAKFIPLNGTCQQTRDPFARKPSETVFENSSRQTRVKKKGKKKKRKRGERLLSFVVSHRIMAWKIFLQLRIRLVEYHSPLRDDFVRETDLLDI